MACIHIRRVRRRDIFAVADLRVRAQGALQQSTRYACLRQSSGKIAYPVDALYCHICDRLICLSPEGCL